MCRGHQLYMWQPYRKRDHENRAHSCNTNRDRSKTGSKQLWILSQSIASSSRQQWGSQIFLLQKQLHEPEGEPGGEAPKMTFLGPGKTGRFWLKPGQEIPGAETLLYLCCCRTPKLDAPNRASRVFRNFCCLLQLTQSHWCGSCCAWQDPNLGSTRKALGWWSFMDPSVKAAHLRCEHGSQPS